MGLSLAILASVAAAVATVDVSVEPLAAVPLARHTAVVTVTNRDAVALAGLVTLTVKPPVESARTARQALSLPASGVGVATLAYELFEPGGHAVTVVVTDRDGAECGRWAGSVTVADPAEVPQLFPSYYRQQLTVVGGQGVSASFGELVPATGGAAHVSAAGPGTVRFASGAGERTLAVTVVPRPSGARPLYAVDADNRLLTGDQPWFPLGIYLTPESPGSCRELREAGFDLVSLNPLPAAQMRPVLDRFAEHGLRVWVPVSHDLDFSTDDEADKKRRLGDLVAAVGDHPALALWESIDEPAWGGVSAHGLRAGYQFLRTLDPQRPVWTNHAPRNRVDTLAYYNQATDIAGCDIYPVPAPQTQSNLPNPALSVVGDETRKAVASVAARKPVLMVLQGFAWKTLDRPDAPDAVYPTFAESRSMAYDAIVAGAAGLLYWGVAFTPRPSAFWSDLKGLVSELRAIAPVLAAVPLAGERAATVVGGGDSVRVSHRQVGAGHWLLVVSRNPAACEAEIVVPGAPAVVWRRLFEADPGVAVVGDHLRVPLPAWGVAVLTTDPECRPVRRDFAAEAAPARPPQPVPVEPGNAVRNPSFEQDSRGSGLPAGWHSRYPFTAQLDPTAGHTGTTSLRLESAEAGFRPLLVQYACPAEPLRRCRLSAWLRSDTPGVKARVYAEWVVAGQYHGGILPWVAPGPEWAEQAVEFETSPDPGGNLYVVVQVEGPGRVWFDDVRLGLAGTAPAR